MRDNAGENKLQEVVDFFESMGVKNYYRTPHEKRQNGLAEAAINSSWCYQEQSWWNPGWAIDSASDSNPQWQDVRPRMSPTEHESAQPHRNGCMGKGRIYPDFEHSGPGHGFISTQKEETKASICRGQLRYLPWIWALYQFVFIPHSGKEYKDVVQSSEIREDCISNSDQGDDRRIPVSDQATDILIRTDSLVKYVKYNPYNQLHIYKYTRIH